MNKFMCSIVSILFLWLTMPSAYAGMIERVSLSSTGTQGNESSHASSISADGRFVAFESRASNLVEGDINGTDDIFVHDRETGTVELVSVSSNGAQANRSSGFPSISADGRFVAFESRASNLIVGDTNNEMDVFLHDRTTGSTERVSVSSSGAQANALYSSQPSISADGRFVAFSSFASNLVDSDTNNDRDVFVHDRATGTTERVSVSSSGEQTDFLYSRAPSISADGRFVAFQSASRNLVAGDTNGKSDIFVHDRATGTTERVSVSSSGAQGSDPGGKLGFGWSVNQCRWSLCGVYIRPHRSDLARHQTHQCFCT